MAKTAVLQVPITKSLKSEAEVVASDYGFSSLQEAVRVFLTQLSVRRIGIGFGETDVILSTKARSKYNKMLNDLKENKNFTRVSSVGELMQSLDAD